MSLISLLLFFGGHWLFYSSLHSSGSVFPGMVGIFCIPLGTVGILITCMILYGGYSGRQPPLPKDLRQGLQTGRIHPKTYRRALIRTVIVFLLLVCYGIKITWESDNLPMTFFYWLLPAGALGAVLKVWRGNGFSWWYSFFMGIALGVAAGLYCAFQPNYGSPGTQYNYYENGINVASSGINPDNLSVLVIGPFLCYGILLVLTSVIKTLCTLFLHGEET